MTTTTDDPLIAERLPWVARAACRGLTRTMYDWETQHGSPAAEMLRRARSLCQGCEVRQPCLLYALDMFTITDDHGLWGGTTRDERRALRVRRRVSY